MLGVIIAAYRDFESRVQILITKGFSKSDRVREIIRNNTGKLTKTEILELCPDISPKTVERSLSSLQKSGDIYNKRRTLYNLYLELGQRMNKKDVFEDGELSEEETVRKF